MKVNLNSLAIGLLVSSLSSTLWANSNVYNNTDEKVKIFWTASGCAGAKPAPHGGMVVNVCATTFLSPGEQSDYHFKDGTSSRKVIMAEGLSVSQDQTGNKGKKKRCVVSRPDPSSDFKLKCDYTKDKFEAVKAGTTESQTVSND